ncbi:diaminopimelate decarboxylase [Patescibacteria group bacterium]
MDPGIFGEIEERFGTPTYVYDKGTIQDRLRRLFGIPYQPKEILYAMKANSNPSILRILKEKGAGIDAVSPGEIALALRVGFPPTDILFTGNNITDAEMDFALQNGVLLNIDSLSRLAKLGQRYPGQRVCVRINPDVGAGHHDHCITGGPESKFGIWYSETDRINEIAAQYNLRIIGVHQHIGSQILEVDKFSMAMDVLLRVAPEFPDLEFIDFGGGFGVPYTPEEQPLNIEELGRMISETFSAFCQRYGKELTLVIEPGRYLVAEAGYLLTRANTVKRNPDGRVFVGVDSGFNHLVRPAMYGSYHEIVNISNPTGKEEIVDIVGNLCESGDRFAKQRKISQARKGDLLVIKTAGAYGYSMSSRYNLRPRPPEVLVGPNNNLQLIRERETIENLIGGS